MKKITAIIAMALMSLVLVSCGDASDGPLTEAQQAEKYNMSVGEFKEQKNAAASMNMTIEDHLKMMDTSRSNDMSGMDMGDDSSMIEDDSDMSDMTHTMDDGTTMTDKDMHMETMHDGEEIDDHGSDTHGDHE